MPGHIEMPAQKITTTKKLNQENIPTSAEQQHIVQYMYMKSEYRKAARSNEKKYVNNIQTVHMTSHDEKQ